MKLAVAGSQATWVADASNLSEISGRRIPNDQVQPPMMAKLTKKQPAQTNTLPDYHPYETANGYWQWRQ